MRFIALSLLALVGCGAEYAADSQNGDLELDADAYVESGAYHLQSVTVGSWETDAQFEASITVDADFGTLTVSGAEPTTVDLLDRDPEDWATLCSGRVTEVVDLDVDIIEIAGYELQDPRMFPGCETRTMVIRGTDPYETTCGGGKVWTMAVFGAR